jgi:transcriptional regulator with XRE-family HTH domain
MRGDFAQAVGVILRTWRQRAQLRQTQLAERAGVTQEAVSNYERGVREPRLLTALLLARALGVGVGELLEAAEKHQGRLDRCRRVG